MILVALRSGPSSKDASGPGRRAVRIWRCEFIHRVISRCQACQKNFRRSHVRLHLLFLKGDHMRRLKFVIGQ